MTTAQTLIKDALVEIGAIGTIETPEADDAQLCLRRLNRMIDGWALRNLLAYHVRWETFTLPEGTQTRTIGTGGQVNVTRPVRIETGSFVRVNGTDYPLRVASRDEFAAIDLKSLGGAWPCVVYLEAASPLGILHFYPTGGCEVHLALQTQLSQFAALTTDYTLPPGVEDAVHLSLSEILCRPYSRPLTPDLMIAARNARKALKLANYQIPELDVGSREPHGMAGFLSGA
jgi:hypothetical protein